MQRGFATRERDLGYPCTPFELDGEPVVECPMQALPRRLA